MVAYLCNYFLAYTILCIVAETITAKTYKNEALYIQNDKLKPPHDIVTKNLTKQNIIDKQKTKLVSTTTVLESSVDDYDSYHDAGMNYSNNQEQDPLISILSKKDYKTLLTAKGYKSDDRRIYNTEHSVTMKAYDLRRIGDDDLAIDAGNVNATEEGKLRRSMDLNTMKKEYKPLKQENSLETRNWRDNNYKQSLTTECKRACKTTYKIVCQDFSCNSNMQNRFMVTCDYQCEQRFLNNNNNNNYYNGYNNNNGGYGYDYDAYSYNNGYNKNNRYYNNGYYNNKRYRG